LRIAEIPATIFTILSCVAYAFLTEVGAPVWRATLMCAIFLSTRLLYRDRAMVNALGAAALGLLVFDPRQLFTASFQMTFLCVLIVAAIAVPLVERTSGLYRQALAHWDADDYGPSLPPKVAQFRVDLRLIAGRLARFIGRRWSLRLVRGMSHLACVYSNCCWCRQLCRWAWLSHGLLLSSRHHHRPSRQRRSRSTHATSNARSDSDHRVGIHFSALAKIPALLTAVALQAITGTVRGLGNLRLADLRVATPSLVMIDPGLRGSDRGDDPRPPSRSTRRNRRSRVALLASPGSGLATLRPTPQIRSGVLEVTSIDVGEGDAILVVTPQGRTLLSTPAVPSSAPARNSTSAKT
jgi:competence protein ComEC